MTGTKIIKIDHKLAKVRTDIVERLSTLELEAFNQIPMTPESIADFKVNYCGTMAPEHPVFSKDNQLYLCDHSNHHRLIGKRDFYIAQAFRLR